MKHGRFLLSLSCVLALVPLAGPASSAPAAAADAILGVWAFDVDTGGVRVEITPGAEGYEGRIVWLEDPIWPDDDAEGRGGQEKIDALNPDPALRDRPILGLQILTGLVYDERRDEWNSGRIYAPDQGRTYRCTIKMNDDGHLEVRGFVKIAFIKLGRTIEWQRFSD